MVGNTRLYLAPKSAPRAFMGVNGCAPLGGWWTDLMNSLSKAGTTGLTLWQQYQQGKLTETQYKAALEQQKSASEQTAQLAKYGVLAAFGLAAVVLLSRKK